MLNWVGTLRELALAIRLPQPDGLRQTTNQAKRFLGQQLNPTETNTQPNDAVTAAVRYFALADNQRGKCDFCGPDKRLEHPPPEPGECGKAPPSASDSVTRATP
ncbi:hypothetical protein [Mycobacterium lepromatosis]|uniref:hypothetical protein n=1 Tax=Mycobacterium lepromatosis TaxID=480418 RepID=UPI0005F865FE|nr:hypothetical protein [Mycobacterium lepromatosis]